MNGMKQLHAIVLWKRAEDRAFDEIAEEAYRSLENLQHFPPYLRPNYLTADCKNNVEEFPFNDHKFKEILKANRIGSDDTLGYAVSFFSSKTELQSCSIRMKVGIKNEKFTNSLVINFPYIMDLEEQQNIEMITGLFRRLVRDFRPFWGAIVNKSLAKKYDSYLHDGFPAAAFWINYWGKDIITKIGENKIEEFIKNNPSATYSNGIFRLTDRPLDIYNESDMSLQYNAEKILP